MITDQLVESVALLLEVVEGNARGEIEPVVRLALKTNVLQPPYNNVNVSSCDYMDN